MAGRQETVLASLSGLPLPGATGSELLLAPAELLLLREIHLADDAAAGLEDATAAAYHDSSGETTDALTRLREEFISKMIYLKAKKVCSAMCQ